MRATTNSVARATAERWAKGAERMSKRLELVGGAFALWNRSELETADRVALKRYLEARGFAVYREETTTLLRETALADFDGEKDAS